MDALKKSKQERTTIRTKLAKFKKFLETYNQASDIYKFKARVETFSSLWNSFEVEQNKIESFYYDKDEKAEEFEKQLKIRDEFEEDYYDAKAKVLIILDQSEKISVVTKLENSESKSNNIRLPDVKIPDFNGDYKQWLTFRDLFNSIIHTNEKLNNVTKFQYLVSYLKGEAARTIESIQITNENYPIVYDMLCKKYENNKYIINQHIKALIHLEPCKSESACEISELVNNFQKHFRVLNNLRNAKDHGEIILCYLLQTKMDKKTRTEWESSSVNKENVTISELIEFLSVKHKVLKTVDETKLPIVKSVSVNQQINKGSKPSHTFIASVKQCALCKGSHGIFECKEFLESSVKQREEKTYSLKLCYNCLRPGHSVYNCLSSSRCSKCNKKHNSLLHFDQIKLKETTSVNKQELLPTTSANSITHDMNIMLSTIVLNILDAYGQWHSCRALLDSGSQSNFISSELCNKLHLTKNKTAIPIQGIAGIQSSVKHRVKSTISSTVSDFNAVLEFLVLTTIVEKIPVSQINIDSLMIHKLKLADPNFNVPNKIDLLIGAELFYDILLHEEQILVSDTLRLQNSQFGYIVTGKASIQHTKLPKINCSVVQQTGAQTLDQLLQKFWDIDQFKCSSLAMSIEEKSCEDEFIQTYTRNSEGRYIVNLPIKDSVNAIGESKDLAVKRFESAERKFNKCVSLKTQYCDFINEYLKLDHMELCNENDNSQLHYFLPYHAVIKPQSTTTKLRVVFDGSAKSSSGASLNDKLKVGPKVQQDLFQIMLRFRKHQIAITGDIEKMYRQVLINNKHHCLQSILWRNVPDQKLQTYHLKTVTYGTASAPYLATRVLKQLALDEANSFPVASKVLLSDFYVDDLLSGGKSVNEVCKLQNDLQQLLSRGGFKLHKWASNSNEVMNYILNKETNDESVIVNKNTHVKTLGLLWEPDGDYFSYRFSDIDPNQIVSKRNILAEIAKIYDPLGLCAPVVFTAKLMMQKLWQMVNINWDTLIVEPSKSNWLVFRSDLAIINQMKIDRCILPKGEIKKVELHGFCDASEVGYGACIYMRSENQSGEFAVRLICAKSRVAPLKKQTLPRLELCGALLLSLLMDVVQTSLDMQFNKIVLWCDSTIVLSWIATPSCNLKTFVSNRIAEIQQFNFDWRHISTKDNPADIVSRGLFPKELINSNLWWNGPPFLNQCESKWPVEINWQCKKLGVETEYKEIEIVLPMQEKEKNWFIELFSGYDKLIRITALVLRFIHNVKHHKEKKLVGFISVEERQNAITTLIKCSQKEDFKDEIKCLQGNMPISKKSKLISLNPFLDGNNILRVGGRLNNSNLTFNQKHPSIISSNHKLANLLVNYEHIRNLHCGPQALLAVVRQRYWIIGGRNLTKNVVHNCVTCVRNKPKFVEQLMGQLPKSRITQFRTFLHTGIDFCGPVYVYSGIRGKRSVKAYICVFVCFATKAIHLELVGDLSTQAFLSALRRFIARRGRCAVIYSDNATNFVGANNQLKELKNLFFSQNHQEIIQKMLCTENIQWKFIPSQSPHFGGLWEAAVKSAKHHRRRVISNQRLTHDEHLTILAQVEACLNSRPITPISENVEDLSYLTPGHFLIFDSLTSVIEPNYEEVKINRLSRWQHVQQIVQHFWTRWSKEYLSSLQVRNKWRANTLNIEPGMLVLIKEDNIPPTKWLMARVIKTHPGQDQHVRVATVKTSKGVLQRPVVKLCPLPIETELTKQ